MKMTPKAKEDTSGDESLTEKIDDKILEVLQEEGIKDFYPPQAESLKYSLNNDNLIVSIPTASGKTLIAEISAVQMLLKYKKKGIQRKIIYLCPLKALASEKFKEFRDKWSKIGIRIGISVGDVDNYNFRVFRNDVIIMTNEKADSLFRNSPKYLKQIGMVIIDEIHLINDEYRGITLEILLTRIKTANPGAQIIGLSATINNADELARWLDAKLVKSNWRPVKLKEGYYKDDAIIYSNEQTKPLDYRTKDAVYNLSMDVLDDGGQCLVFVNSRRNSRSYAKKLMRKIAKRYNETEIVELLNLSDEFKALNASSNLTRDEKILINTLKAGVAFHNAGLNQKQRKFIEDNFRKGLIRILTATPTLAAGVNTPARRVIIQSLYRYDGKRGGMRKIPIMEYKQMVGRAGRPGYDPYGDSIMLSSNPSKTEELAAYYVFGETEWILSKLNSPGLLQTHLLGTITMKKAATQADLVQFLKSTFLAYQVKYGTNDLNGDAIENQYSDKKKTRRMLKFKEKVEKDGGRGSDPLNLPDLDTGFVCAADLADDEDVEILDAGSVDIEDIDVDDGELVEPELDSEELDEKIEEIVENAVTFLYDYDFITQEVMEETDEYIYKSTKVGKLTSQLYLSPYTAESVFRRLKLLVKIKEEDEDSYFKINEISLMYIIAMSGEIYGVRFNKSDYEAITASFRRFEKSLEMFTFEYDEEENLRLFDDMNALKATFIMADWINEIPLADITEKNNIGSGDLQRVMDTGQWLARAINQFSKLLGADFLIELSENLNIRLKYGIKKQLVNFVKIKGIGRVRARILYKAGVFSINDLVNVSDKQLEKLELFSQKFIKNMRSELRRTYPKLAKEKGDPIKISPPKHHKIKSDTSEKINHNSKKSRKKKSGKKTKQTTLF